MNNVNPLDNLSYTNKDFQTIYPELLDTVKKLTYKWDPTISNESDPGVILIKLNALIADKNNYNIDKNILECFPDTVTQMGNAYKLFSQLGYNMSWYHSATGKVSFRYSGDDVEDTSIRPILPLFKMLCDEEKEIVYTTIERKELPLDKDVVEVDCIQGIIRDYTVANSKLIGINALDSRNRLYFPVSNVAENGIFITNAGTPTKEGEYLFGTTGEWRKSENLHIESFNTKCYYFGVEQSTNRCYIEFPTDIGSLIGNGLLIKYIQSDGDFGNVPAFKITKFYDDYKVSFGESEIDFTNSFNITNMSYITNGREPESIEDAYDNYKKLVGTFDTLVTLRDYLNYITNDDLELVSNGVVSDRTNDIQSSYKIMQTTDEVSKTVSVVAKSDDGNNEMKAFDLKTYFLEYSYFPKFSSGADVDTIISQCRKSYDKSFNFMLSDAPGGNPLDTPDSIKNAYDGAKSIQHDFKPKETGKVLLFKNKFDLNLTIIPKAVVTDIQRDEIQKNVLEKLYRSLQSKNIVFGEEVSYEQLYDICVDADERIKAIALDSADYTTYAVVFDSASGLIEVELPKKVEEPSATDEPRVLTDGEKVAIDVVAKNVIGGVTPLYDKNKNYSMNIGQASLNVYDNIKSITTDTELKYFDLASQSVSELNEKTLELLDNESLIFYAPNLIEKAEYSVGIKYVYYTTSEYNGQDSAYIPANTDYVLSVGQHLFLFWKEEDSADAPYMYAKYDYGTILHSTTKLYSVTNSKAQNNTDAYGIKSQLITGGYEGEGQILGTLNDDIYAIDGTILSATKKVTIKETNTVDLDKYNYCYWITNNKSVDEDGTENYVMTAYPKRSSLYQLVHSFNAGETYISNKAFSSADGITKLVQDDKIVMVLPVQKTLSYLDKDGNQYFDTVTTFKGYEISAPEDEESSDDSYVETSADILKMPDDVPDIIGELFEEPDTEINWFKNQPKSSTNATATVTSDAIILNEVGNGVVPNIPNPLYIESVFVDGTPLAGYTFYYTGGELHIECGLSNEGKSATVVYALRPSDNINSKIASIVSYSNLGFTVGNGVVLNEYKTRASGVDITYSYNLKANEYFIYTDKDKKAMSVLGMGTSIVTTKSFANDGDYSPIEFKVRSMDLDYEDIITKGLPAFSDSMWYRFDEGRDGDVKAVENRLVVVGPGSTVGVSLKPIDSGGTVYWTKYSNLMFNHSGVRVRSNNGEGTNWETVNDILYNYTIRYRASEDDSWTTLPNTTNPLLTWDAYSVLNINSGLNNPQEIVLNDTTNYIEGSTNRHSLELSIEGQEGNVIIDSDHVVGEDVGNTIYMQTSSTVSLSGGDEIDTTSVIDGVVTYLGMYLYADNNYKSDDYTIIRNDLKYNVTVADGFSDNIVTINFRIPTYSQSNTMIPLEFFNDFGEGTLQSFKMSYVQDDADVPVDPMSFSSDSNYDTQDDEIQTEITASLINDGVISRGTYYYDIPVNQNTNSNVDVKIVITHQEGSSANGDSFNILPLFIHTTRSIFDEDSKDFVMSEQRVIDKVGELNITHQFDYTYQPDNNVRIDNPLKPVEFFNPNHCYNSYTIAKIDEANVRTVNVR